MTTLRTPSAVPEAAASGASPTPTTVADVPHDDVPGFRHRTLDVEGVRLHLVDGGDPTAPAIVLLAGFPQTWYAWHKVMTDLVRTYRVIAFDLPGQGHSGRPVDGYDTGTVASRIRSAVHELGLTRYWLVAHDVGAWVAAPYALRGDGTALLGVVLMDAGIPGVSLPEAVPLDERAAKLAHFAFHAVPDLPETLIAGREREYVEWFLTRKSAVPGTFGVQDVARYARLLAADGGLRAVLAYYRAITLSAAQNRELAERGQVRVPLLAVSGEQGSIPDMAAALRPIAADVTGVRISGSGHFIPDEQPELLLEALHGFFSRWA
ncbi:alpha/beta fold hydrolase [Promicromonospora sp. NPDC050880]|uniref:alpha/beta fold hydrolase n=1 Tax=Promicromonospora sp. NPDC050880 TaxID=3364406 RepID=UPI003790E027